VVSPVAGEVVVGAPKSFAAEQARCVGAETVDAVWVVHLSGSGLTLDLPVFVVRTSGGEAVLGPSKLVLCPSPTTRLVDLTFAASALTSPVAAGEYRWRSLSTPYAPGTAQPDPAGAREAQAIVRVPTRLTIAVARSKLVTRTSTGPRTWTRLTITGALTENGAGLGGRTVVLRSGSGVVVATTSSDGTYRKTVLTRRAVSIVATSTIPARDLGPSGCTATFGPVPCLGATIAASSLTSRRVRAAAFRFR
jgi:hypothetical protein